MKNGYNTVTEEYENLIVIERSKFICNIKGVENEEDAREFIDKIRKKHSLANHNCYAYIADDKGLVQKFSDDGEPQGTAGLPMLEVLKNKTMYKTVAVVTRYFGGIKLGTGGLTRAYGGSVAEALSKAKIADMQPSRTYSTMVEYDGSSLILKLLCGDGIKIVNTEFGNSVRVEFVVRQDVEQRLLDHLFDSFNGKIEFKKLSEGFYPF